MILIRVSRLLANNNCFCLKSFLNSPKIRCFSAQKSDPKVKKIKQFINNNKKLDSIKSDVKTERTGMTDNARKAVLLYSNEKSWFYRRLFALNCLQFLFWCYISNQGIALLLRKPKRSLADDDLKGKPLLTKFKTLWAESSTQMVLSVVMLTLGQISVALLALFTIRSVRYVILKPGGQSVRITTFSITGSANRYRNYDIPVQNVSSTESRTTATNYIPLKVKGKYFYFLVDLKGHFYKPALFDQTVGVFRILK